MNRGTCRASSLGTGLRGAGLLQGSAQSKVTEDTAHVWEVRPGVGEQDQREGCSPQPPPGFCIQVLTRSSPGKHSAIQGQHDCAC
jgi:hypothetical protein